MNTPVTIPEFEMGEQFIQLRPCLGNYKYRFLLLQNIEIYFFNPFVTRKERILFKDTDGNVWMEITRYSIIIHKKYAWDGCTPKRWFGIWWGTPDFKKTIIASLIHDALLQFSSTKHFPLSRKEVDSIFKELLRKNNFSLYHLYYLGVRFGSKYLKSEYKNIESELKE